MMRLIAWICISLVLCSCTPKDLSESQIQTAIAQTLSSNQGLQATQPPTVTWTPFVMPATHTPSPSMILSPTLLASCISANTVADLGLVTKVLDGATVQVKINGEIQLIHYLGIKAPDKTKPTAEQAYQANFDLTNNQVVNLIKDPASKDDSARYVFVAEKFINFELVYQGIDSPDQSQNQLMCASQFIKALHHAQEYAIGQWAPTSTPPPSDLQTAVAKNAAARQQNGQNSRGGGTIDFSNSTCSRYLISFVAIRGTVTNHTLFTLMYLSLRGTIYDAAGKQINTYSSFAASDQLSPGQSSTFEVDIQDPNLAFASCSIGVDDYIIK